MHYYIETERKDPNMIIKMKDIGKIYSTGKIEVEALREVALGHGEELL